jgi:hypothetical protein
MGIKVTPEKVPVHLEYFESVGGSGWVFLEAVPRILLHGSSKIGINNEDLARRQQIDIETLRLSKGSGL